MAGKERYLFNGIGVLLFIADEIARRLELPAGLMCFSAADVIAVMFSREHKAIVQNATGADCWADVLPDMLSSLKKAQVASLCLWWWCFDSWCCQAAGRGGTETRWASLYGFLKLPGTRLLPITNENCIVAASPAFRVEAQVLILDLK